MKQTILAATAFACFLCRPSFAVIAIESCKVTTCTGGETIVTPITCDGTTTITCYDNLYQVESCQKCFTGYTLTSASASLPCGMLVTYNTCVKTCSSDNDCTANTTSWSCSDGFCSRKYGTCLSSKQCGSTLQNACDVGYYGSGITCTKCPENIGLGLSTATTSDIGATSVADCFVPAGGTYSGGNGRYTFIADCHYEE